MKTNQKVPVVSVIVVVVYTIISVVVVADGVGAEVFSRKLWTIDRADLLYSRASDAENMKNVHL